ncbi:rubrerythrin family protein [Candidatus Galacturonibacter soehngenii]|uniref:Rubrerythrin family protein n=1 Tax=Candidatus Galacturonatibacter soehngenii TaxID=2307010 RepID=A0A7V7UBF2_9FIRM|nr:ferritin family protein [Candidatus Galacturonibacter soehngenii]KAB1438048.1 rubrerythrin family protein [Candidatus Galacturonibacter soehngenii]MBA4688775.1 rubrerythrin family protein [Candidatus Galacturonibacter soehngenii]
MDFQDSQTFKNLLTALDVERNNSTTYRIYGNEATKEGYIQIGEIFHETAHNEQEHAVIWMNALNNGMLGDTLTNLRNAAAIENYEWTTMYRDFAKVAREEGYEDIASLFEGIGLIEKHHDYRFTRLANNVESGRVFCKEREAVWICINCGNVYWGQCAPEICPICLFPQGYYEINCENY